MACFLVNEGYPLESATIHIQGYRALEIIIVSFMCFGTNTDLHRARVSTRKYL